MNSHHQKRPAIGQCAKALLDATQAGDTFRIRSTASLAATGDFASGGSADQEEAGELLRMIGSEVLVSRERNRPLAAATIRLLEHLATTWRPSTPAC
jgi:hypothetical protein